MKPSDVFIIQLGSQTCIYTVEIVQCLKSQSCELLLVSEKARV